MKKNLRTIRKGITILISAMMLTSCATGYTSAIVGGEYNIKKDVTEYFVLPYGSVSIPGEWTKTTYNSNARQQFFTNKDSVIISIAFSRYDMVEFNRNGKLKGIDFLNAFYRWEADYFASSGYSSTILETDTEKQYILYHIYRDKTDNYFLIREMNGNVSNYSIHVAKDWSESQKTEFLKGLLEQH